MVKLDVGSQLLVFHQRVEPGLSRCKGLTQDTTAGESETQDTSCISLLSRIHELEACLADGNIVAEVA